jgi:hypothetical protein
MASTLQAAAGPRFLLPKISQRLTPVRPTSIAPLANTSKHQHMINGRLRSFSSAVAHQNARTSCTTYKPSIRPLYYQGAATDGSEKHRSLVARRAFSATAIHARDHHFDTLKFVQRLKDEGFTEEQAVAMMKVLSDVIEERQAEFNSLEVHALTDCSIQNLTRTMVLREDQEKVTYTQKVDFAKLRSELLTADSTESSLSRASHERLTNELAKLNSRLRDEVQRTQASVRLDLNLEKGRIREEANVQELKIKETETRIEQETAVLRERLEAVKFSTLQWLMYVFITLMFMRVVLTLIQRSVHWYCRVVTRCLASVDVEAPAPARHGLSHSPRPCGFQTLFDSNYVLFLHYNIPIALDYAQRLSRLKAMIAGETRPHRQSQI